MLEALNAEQACRLAATHKPEVMVGAVQNKVDAATGELTDAATRKFVASQLASFADFIRRAV